MTGQADVRWIWMAVALVVVAVPVLTVIFNREIRLLQQRVSALEHASTGRAERAVADIEARASRAAVEVEARANRAAAEVDKRVAAAAVEQREQLLDVLRTLSAMRPAEPEFTEEYYVADPPGREP